jgi:hypothetical protein
MGIPTAYKISESGGGNEQGNMAHFRGKLVYRIPQDEVETYRTSFTPGLNTIGINTATTKVSSAGIVTSRTAGIFAASHVGNPITIANSGTFTITSYTSSRTVDTTFTKTTSLGVVSIVVQSYRTWADNTGVFAARLKEYSLEAQYPGVPGHSRLTLWYETPNMRQVVSEATNRAMIEMDLGGVSERLKREVVGSCRVIEGPIFATADLGRNWVVCRGSNVTWRPGLTDIRITCASTQSAIDSVNAQVGKTNKFPLPNFGNAATGTIMFKGAKLQNQLPWNSLWMTQYYFVRDPGEGTARLPWHCRVRKDQKVAIAVPVFNTAGAVIANETATVTCVKPGGTSADRILHRGSVDFTFLDTKLNWL